jgi:hypothetical protein
MDRGYRIPDSARRGVEAAVSAADQDNFAGGTPATTTRIYE